MYVRCVKHLKSKLNRIKFGCRKNIFFILESHLKTKKREHVPDVARYVCYTCSRVDLELYNTIILSKTYIIGLITNCFFR